MFPHKKLLFGIIAIFVSFTFHWFSGSLVCPYVVVSQIPAEIACLHIPLVCSLDLSRLLHLIGLSKVTSAFDRPRNSILPPFSTNGEPEVTMKNLIGLSKQVTSASTKGEVPMKVETAL